MKKCVCELCNCGRHRCPQKPLCPYRKGNTTTSDLTEYSERFPVHTGLYHPPNSMKPKPEVEHDKKRMDWTTTSKTYFIPHEVTRQQGCKPAEYRPKLEKFDHGTTYTQEFNTTHKITQPAVPFRPREMPRSTDKMVFIQSYKEDFKKWEIQRKPSTKPKDSYQTPTCKFGGPTTFQDEFIYRSAAPRGSFKPANAVQHSGVPVEQVDLGTTMAQDYVKHRIQRIVLAKGPLPAERSTAPLENRSTMREDFQPWGVHTRQPILQKDEDWKSNEKMEDLTTFRANFTAHKLSPNESFKPPHQPASSNAPMEEFTTYKSEFIPKRISVCPASFELPPGYVFEDRDDSGHKYFRKISHKDNPQ